MQKTSTISFNIKKLNITKSGIIHYCNQIKTIEHFEQKHLKTQTLKTRAKA